MNQIFVNLKRFDIPKSLGGICPQDNPVIWIDSIMQDTIEMELGSNDEFQLVYLLPEGFILSAMRARENYSVDKVKNLSIGVQGVHWDDVVSGKNFGAFTSSLPATAARNLGCEWVIVGHSEERKAKRQVMAAFQPAIETETEVSRQANKAVDQLVNTEVLNTLRAGMNVLLCIGESAEERGEGSFDEQKPRIQEVLKSQLIKNLAGVEKYLSHLNIVIGYEPIWAIGPGKNPPGEAYISFVSAFVKEVIKEILGMDVTVVYGGGLKEENAEMIAGIETIGGGLIALTRFSGDIGFDVAGLKGIIYKYLSD